ncbi:hypothetical protein [Lentzea sp. NPDC004782]|uniref:hypothetical protein n=1 Tax=Lentzea sp. NPDC004782 TaxID=3154458 RepID=UPI0033B24EC8
MNDPDGDPNPYKVPGMRSHIGPLCPHVDPSHEDYYVPVDHTETAYAVFREALGEDLTTLREEGRLAVALGWDGCGKTSLLNRCAAWVKRKLGQGCHIVSFTGTGRDSEPREVRENRIFKLLIHELGDRGLLEPKQRDELTDASDKGDLDFGYLYASRWVLKPGNMVLVVLLPRTEIPREIENYARWAHPNLVFLAESRKVENVDSHWPVIESAHNSAVPIRLDVGTLAKDDGWAFVQSRKGNRTDAPDYPYVSEETIRRVTEARRLSIGELHKLLYGAYQEVLENGARWRSKDTGLRGEVTFEDLLSFYFRRLGRQR